MTITGAARLAAILGWPVGHSRSPQLHGHWLDRLGIDGAVLPLAVRPEDLAETFRLLPRIGFTGWCLTIPHKQAALGLVHRLTQTARAIGSVNHVAVAEDGALVGNNTDAFGFLASLRAGAPSWDPAAAPAVVIGAGGAARAVVWALHDAGVREIRITNRTPARAEGLVTAFGPSVSAIGWQDRAAALGGAGLLVNTTSLGMTGQPPLDLDLGALPSWAPVTDIVYSPLETALLAAARARGNPVVDGLGMLLHQARPLFESWFGVDPAVDDAVRAAVLGSGGP